MCWLLSNAQYTFCACTHTTFLVQFTLATLFASSLYLEALYSVHAYSRIINLASQSKYALTPRWPTRPRNHGRVCEHLLHFHRFLLLWDWQPYFYADNNTNDFKGYRPRRVYHPALAEQAEKSTLFSFCESTHACALINILLLQYNLSALVHLARYCIDASADAATTVETFADNAYDDLSTLRNQFHLILEDFTISRARRNTVTGIMCRLSVLMQVCMNLSMMSDILDEDSHIITPCAEAIEIYELSLIYLPAKRRTMRIAVISD